MAVNLWDAVCCSFGFKQSRPALLLPIVYLLNCPRGVLCNQRLRISCRALERRKVRWIAHIAERDTHIA
jgi:hypothetical protein